MKYPNRTLPSLVTDTYTVEVDSSAPVAFKITGGALIGGSSFAVNVHNEKGALATCDTFDNFDGSYFVRCPHIGGLLTVRFQLTHVLFGAFAPFNDMSVLADMNQPLFECRERTNKMSKMTKHRI